MFKSILVVCVGNICRSPMAEGLLKQKLSERNVRVESAGIGALVGRPADDTALELAAERGVDIGAHRARQISPGHVREFELILVMEEWHKKEIEARLPEARGRVFRIGHWSDLEVPDPYRKPREAFEEALQAIEQGIEDWVKKL